MTKQEQQNQNAKAQGYEIRAVVMTGNLGFSSVEFFRNVPEMQLRCKALGWQILFAQTL